MKNILTLLFYSFILFSCTENTLEYKKGKIENLVYQNEYIGVSLKIDNNWKSQPIDLENQIWGEKILMFHKTLPDNLVLLNLNHKETKSSFLIGIEKSTGAFGLSVDTEMYFTRLKSVLEYVPLNYKYPNELSQIQINGNVWNVLETEYLNNKRVFQDYYAISKNGYYILMISTYESEKQKEMNIELLNKIVLKN